jgi:tripartite-type tricarboxylate transporter receptor subunit TctC
MDSNLGGNRPALLHRWRDWGASLAGAISLSIVLVGPASAQISEGYFKGKQVLLLVGGTAGGGIDLGARLLARYLGKYLPGNPLVTVQDMPGAGGVRLLEHLVQQAPRDGTTIGAFATGPLLEPMVGGRKITYSMMDFTAVGALEKDVTFCATWSASPVKTFEDAKARVTTVAGTGAGSNTDVDPMVLNEVLGTKFKVVTGYLGTQETLVAMERGEVDGRCAFGWLNLNAAKPDWLPGKKVNLLVQIGLVPHPKMPGMPLALDLAKTESDKQLLRLVAAPLSLSRPYLAPPGLPAERAAEVRKAFLDAVGDEGFRADFAKTTAGEQPEPTEGAAMQKVIAEMYATPKDVADRLRKIVTP